jgi:8-oxo-dGTP pyrophosphatase MutT (NUDIX family)
MSPEHNHAEPLVDAAVLVPLYRDGSGNMRVVLVRRTDGGVHGGQIALPGGKREPGDDSLLDTALREAHEEIGLDPDSVEVLVKLPEVVTMTTRFRIQPYLGRITPSQSWTREPREIAEIIDVCVADLARPSARGASMEKFPSWPEARRIEFFHLGPHRLWGATFRILEPLIPRLMNGDWKI